MKKIAVIHFMPLEYYPPVTNLLKVLEERGIFTRVFTTHNLKKRTVFSSGKHKVTRTPFPNLNSSLPRRLVDYFLFNFCTLIHLVFSSPEKILYFESYSAWPVFFYKRFINRGVKVYIHSHEYFSKDWYGKTMRQVKYFHKKEVDFLWREAVWYSHTNEDRIRLFSQDYPFISKDILKVMPNYPLASWIKSTDHLHKKKEVQNVTKTVYIGALSFESTYIKEYCEWVVKQEGAVTLAIYTYNLHSDVEDYLNNLSCDYISFYNSGVEYYNMPQLLNRYDIGLVLYKGNSLNYIYNVPNKFFEYLSCRLHAWYAPEVLGIHKIQEKYNCVKEIDFNNMPNKIEVDKSVNCSVKDLPTCEKSVQLLITELVDLI